MLVSIDWLKEYVDAGLTAESLAAKITMGGIEVEEIRSVGSDSILNLAPTPNRGDCLYITGVAREVSALTGKKVSLPACVPPKGKGKMKESVEVIVKDTKGSPRYTSRVVKGVKIGPSPDWLKKRVESAGVRSINNVVDATNFVLMELGQPVHAFDLRFLKGKKLIIARPSKDTVLKALDEQEYKFTPEDILNMDAERAIGAAGIMGGENSGVADDTTTLVLESAYFDPRTVRRTSKRTGLSSESSKRFEKGVDPEGVIRALHRLTEIVVKVGGGVPSEDWVDIYPKPFQPKEISFRITRANSILGAEIDEKTAQKILASIGCEVGTSKKGTMQVVAPMYRPDLEREIDLIEEVARLYGYNNIKDSMPLIKASSVVRPSGSGALQLARETMVQHGFFEAKTYSFASEEQLKKFGGGKAVILKNPLTADMQYMRTTLLPSLIDCLKGNMNRQVADVRLFEINKVFMPSEQARLSAVMTGAFSSGHWNCSATPLDLFDAKSFLWSVFARLGIPAPSVKKTEGYDFLHPADSFEVLADGQKIGFCGRLHPSLQREYDLATPVYLFEVDMDAIIKVHLARKPVFKPLSRYPVVMRDVALLVESRVLHEEMLASFNKKMNNIVQSIDLFDIYIGKGIPEGKKSMAYRITFGSEERTLSDAEVDTAFKTLVDVVRKELCAEIR